MARILVCGRVAINVTIAGLNGHSVTVESLVDTGAEISLFPRQAVSAVASLAVKFYIPVFVAGSLLHTNQATGAFAALGVQPFRRGTLTHITSGIEVRTHHMPIGAGPFEGVDGLIGMDLLDQCNADLAKDLTGIDAYLFSRV